MARKKSSPEVIEKRIRALRLRLGGATYPQLAREMGCATSTAHEYVMDALTETQQEPADAVRDMELQRLDRMHQALWPTVIGQDQVDENGRVTKEGPSALDRARAVERCLEIQARRAKYLGLDAPTRRIVEVVQHDELVRLTEAMKRECDLLEAEGVEVGDPVEWADRD